MNAEAILSLIGDLVAQVAEWRHRALAAEQRVAELEAERQS